MSLGLRGYCLSPRPSLVKSQYKLHFVCYITGSYILNCENLHSLPGNNSIEEQMASTPLETSLQPCRGSPDSADEDEFDQREDVATGIADALERYTIQSTFKEYLANADDCASTTQLNWLLDERNHPTQNLYFKELQAYQGPALLVHNDGGV